METGVDADTTFCVNICEQFPCKVQLSAFTQVLKLLQNITLTQKQGKIS